MAMALGKKWRIFAGRLPAFQPFARAASIILLLILMQMAYAIPQNIPVHGRITGIGGTPVSSSTGMQFRIYNVPSGGTALYDTGTIFVQADASGLYNYTMPNVNLAYEMVDLITATRAYEANLSVVKSAKQMALTALGIGK